MGKWTAGRAERIGPSARITRLRGNPPGSAPDFAVVPKNGLPMTPASVTPATRPAPAATPAGGVVPERVIEIDARPEPSRLAAEPAMTESRLSELAATIRLR